MFPKRQELAHGRILEILQSRKSVLVEYIETVKSILDLSYAIRENLVLELAKEFDDKGLLPNGEPNKYGLEIEDLIDACKLADG